jgi:hypothetical protein
VDAIWSSIQQSALGNQSLRADPLTRKTHQSKGFLNVDLDVYSRSNLAPLAAALEPKTFILYAGREVNRYGAHFELCGLPKSADAAILGLAALIRSLPSAARKLWDTATTRDFNIGIQANATGSWKTELSIRSIQLVASLNARIVVTVYGETKDLRLTAKGRRGRS